VSMVQNELRRQRQEAHDREQNAQAVAEQAEKARREGLDAQRTAAYAAASDAARIEYVNEHRDALSDATAKAKAKFDAIAAKADSSLTQLLTAWTELRIAAARSWALSSHRSSLMPYSDVAFSDLIHVEARLNAEAKAAEQEIRTAAANAAGAAGIAAQMEISQ
jgi:hypothetical protein